MCQSLEMLFEGDAEVNQVDIDGNTPMHLAVDNGHTDCVKLLLRLGADINVMNIRGSTPVRSLLRPQRGRPPRFLRAHVLCTQAHVCPA
jgi:ankyrin repeat protein